MKKIKAVIIGLGNIGYNFETSSSNKRNIGSHFKSYRLNKNYKVVAVCDTNQEILRAFKKKNNRINTYSNLKKLLSSEKIDVASICVNTENHLKVLKELKSESYLIPYGGKLNSINQNQKVIIASQNIPDNPIGTKILPSKQIPNASPPLPPRIIVINNPKSFQFANALDQNKSHQIKENNSLTKKMLSVPLATGIDLGQSDNKQIKLIRGKGNFQEAMACFQMLSKVLDLPFRRDAIERVLRKALQSNKDINLKLCGDISLPTTASSLGTFGKPGSSFILLITTKLR